MYLGEMQQRIPLAERIRPHTLEDLLGQEHLVGKGGVLRKAIESGAVPSMILWGPPGVGKTTLANIIANQVKVPFYLLSAVNAGVKRPGSSCWTKNFECRSRACHPPNGLASRRSIGGFSPIDGVARPTE